MKNLRINIEVSPELYLKNPETSELGRRIISSSIVLISEIGFEAFTFKKLGEMINSPESSVYRYFKNKHSLLVYLTSWYWSWTEYRLVFATINIDLPKDRLVRSLDILTKPVLIDNSFSYINEVLLSQIIFSESIKTYHTKDVDVENEKGCFKSYKGVVQRVGDIIIEMAPNFPFAHMLVSTVIEGAHQQRFFTKHLPALTDTMKGEDAISEFYKHMTFNLIEDEKYV